MRQGGKEKDRKRDGLGERERYNWEGQKFLEGTEKRDGLGERERVRERKI